MKIIYILLLINFFSCSKDEVNQDAIIYVQSVTISGSNITSGTVGQMTANVLPANADNKTIAWTVSDVSIATVSSSGLLTALKNGNVLVTATASDKNVVSASKEITISSFETSTDGVIEVSNPTQLLDALSKIKAGSSIILTQGTYILNSKIIIGISGTAQNKITLKGKEGQNRPKLDFSSMVENSANQGIVLAADYWHIKGIDIYKAGDNGLQIKGHHDIRDFCTFYECYYTGLQIVVGYSILTILNCNLFFIAVAIH